MNMSGFSGSDDLNSMYEDIILDHYRNPRNTSSLSNPDLELEVNNPFCGDELRIQLNIKGGTITHVSVSGQGCAISQSSGSLLAEKIKDSSIDTVIQMIEKVRQMMNDEPISGDDIELIGDIESLQGVKKFPVRIKCALLGWSALEDLIKKP